MQRIAPHCASPELRARAGKFLAGLLDPVERRNGRQLAEHLGGAQPGWGAAPVAHGALGYGRRPG